MKLMKWSFWVGLVITGNGALFSSELHAQSSATLQHRAMSQDGLGVGLTITPEKDWHVYWKYPGDSGATVKTNWGCDGMPPASQGMKIDPTEWPIPEVLPVGPLVNYGYAHSVTLPFSIPCNASMTKRLTVDAEWLVCKEECIPQYATLELMPMPGDGWNIQDPSVVEFPLRLPSSSVLELQGTLNSPTQVVFSLPNSQSSDASTARFIPDSAGQIVNAAAQTVADGKLTVTLTDSLGSGTQPSGILTGLVRYSDSEAYPVRVSIPVSAPVAANSAANTPGFITLLFWALLGGIILNAMPCVFPVLGLKVYQLVSATPSERRANSILYTVGVCLSMLALGGGIGLLRASGLGVGWGTQLQNPYIVYSLALLFVLLGCNLLGMFELGGSVQSAAGKVKASGPLMDGLLTVLVATPCTAPFMAGAVAIAFTLPIASQLLVFLFLGLGVATPVLLIGSVPALAKLLPRPGAWMDIFKQFLAWPLFASAAWLLTVLIAQVGLERGTEPLFGVVVLGFLVWLFTAIKPVGISKFAILIAGAALLYCFYPAAKPSPNSNKITHVPYDKAELAKLREAGTPVFLDATATWCITCQSNKKLVLHTDAVTNALAEKKAVWMEADWTEPSEEITNLLTEFGRAGVPLDVYFPPHKDPIVLPPILTNAMVLDALAR